jgi:hypothetical protein
MTVTYEPLHPNTIGPPDALTLVHEAASNADAGSFQAAHGNPIYATS